MSLDLQAHVRALLSQVMDPHLDQDLVTAGVLRGVGVDGDKVAVELLLPYPALGWQAELTRQVRAVLEGDPNISAATVAIASRVHAHKVQQGLTPLPGVKNVIAVASGKGGVGKSTTAANLALALVAEGASVGVLDADIYGPSQALMLGVSGKPDMTSGERVLPKRNHGLQIMSIALLVEGEDTALIWRGPMATNALQTLIFQTAWEDLDYLVIDLPPGTGDIQLTLSQRVPLSGAIIVTTPQDLALLDARKGLKMFEKVAVPVLGVVENMATHVCTRCGNEEHIFGHGGGARMAAQYAVPLLGSLPLDIRIREEADSGVPTVVAEPDSDLTRRYREIARKTAARLGMQAREKRGGFPNIVIT